MVPRKQQQQRQALQFPDEPATPATLDTLESSIRSLQQHVQVLGNAVDELATDLTCEIRNLAQAVRELRDEVKASREQTTKAQP